MPLTAGTKVGPYEVVAPLGSGGMGEVYRARDSKLNRDVALKVLPASVATDPDRVARFRREAQVLAALNHPNIAQIHGLEGDHDLALVMELVDGSTLDQLISGGGLPLADALPIARQIAEALEFAHEHGIVHRDLKPANIKVRADGTVKVLDFGLAKAMAADEGSASGDATNSPTLTARGTQMGVILGTAAYMSPEQAKGRPVDRRADIWAFGVVLYEMLAGRRGYEAEDVSDTLAAVLTRDVDWTALPAGTPPRLRALLHDCLVRDPKQRLRDIGEARRAIEQIIRGDAERPAPGSTTSIAPPRVALWSRALPWAVALAAMIVAMVATWRAGPGAASEGQHVTRSRAILSDLAGFVRLSPDGTKLVYGVAKGSPGRGGFQLALRSMDELDGKLLAGTAGANFGVFSPDGTAIAFTEESSLKIKRMPVSGGSASVISEGSFQRGAAWGAGDLMVFAGPKGLMKVAATGGQPEPLTTLDAGRGQTIHTNPQFLPGGRSLLFTVFAAEGPSFAIADLATGAHRIIMKGGLNGRYAPTGHLTFVRDGTLFAAPFDLDRLAVTGPETPMVENVSMTGPPGTGDYTFSDNGLLVYSEAQTADGSRLVWTDRNGKMQEIPGQVIRPWGTGRLSPDGQRVANAIGSGADREIWVADLSRGTVTRLTFAGGVNDRPIWTPDGRMIVYSAMKPGATGIYAVPADGSSPPSSVLASESTVVPTSLAPDGTLVYTAGAGSQARIMLLPPAATPGGTRTARPLRESTGGDGNGQVSPDGKWIALMSRESGSQEIYLLPFPGPGGKTRVSAQGGRDPRWSNKGRELVYWSPDPGNADLMVVDVETSPGLKIGTPRALFSYFSGTTWDVKPDGSGFLLEEVRASGVGAVFVTVTNWFDELRRRAPAKK